MSSLLGVRLASDAEPRRLVVLAAVLALSVGLLGAVAAATVDYTLAYNDARARLVVARRILDSLTPGLAQMGGIWLPLPHLINLPLVQIDVLYRTGLGSVAINLLAFAVLAAATVRIVGALTSRPWFGFLAACAIVLHPDLLFLQSTPMTEPLAVGLVAAAIALLLAGPDGPSRPWLAAVLLALAMLTRYEAWFAAMAVTAVAWLASADRTAQTRLRLEEPAWSITTMAVVAVGVAAGCTWLATGSWTIVTSGFFRPTQTAGRPLAALAAVVGVAWTALGPGLMTLAAIGLIRMVRRVRDRAARWHLLAAAPLAAAALFWYAATAGHPVLHRFAAFFIPPVVWLGAAGADALRRTQPRTRNVMIVLSAAWYVVLWASPPTIREARDDIRGREGGTAVLNALGRLQPGDRLLASMWSVAHVLHDLSAYDIPLRQVVHESNGRAWMNAVASPSQYVQWILVACRSGDTDRVRRSLSRPGGLDAFEIVARGAGLELYRVRPPSSGRRAPPRLCHDT